MRLGKILIGVAVGTYIIAALFYGAHAFVSNPQYDNQGMRYAQESIIAVTTGKFGAFLLEERKYPLLYALPFAVTFEGMLVASGGNLSDASLYLASRVISLVFAFGAILVTWRLGKRLGDATLPVLLLMSSILFLLFTSAIRPHVTVAFWTALSCLFAVRAREKESVREIVWSLLCAAAAFASLQSGLLAFLFPAWGMLQWEKSTKNIAIGVASIVGAAALALVIGYPFLLRPLLGLPSAGGVDLGHDVGLTFGLLQPFRVLMQLLGGEPILIVAAIVAVVSLIRRRSLPHPMIAPILAYCGLFLIVFIFHLSSAGRFFLPIFPFLTLIGALALEPHARWAKPALCVFVIVTSFRLIWLSALPNTYDDMSEFLDTRPRYTVIAVQPDEFFPLDRAKLATEREHAPLTQTIVLPNYSDKLPSMAKTWPICHRSNSSRTTDEIVLLWNDTPFALWHLFETSALGPNMTAYCAKS